MEQSSGEECGICLDALKNPVALPCSHKFCSECLNGWRSKYEYREKEIERKCPLCRQKIPPSRQMVAQLKSLRKVKFLMETDGNVSPQHYTLVVSQVEILERQIGDWTKTIDYSTEDKDCVELLELPTDIYEAAKMNDIRKVLNWLGPRPVKQRLNARDPEAMDFTLVNFAALSKHSDLLSILLQLGADVDPFAADGETPFTMFCYDPEHFASARLLLEWGADISNCQTMSKDELIEERVIRNGNSKLANLLNSEFGGRRCEVINLSKRPDLNGSTCVVEKYLPDKGRYKVTFETSKEVGLVGPQNLKRRDRTPDDCGYYITFENGRTTRRDFASKEECQAFVASLTKGDKSGDVDAEAEARAEQAAASLLAELSIDSFECAKSKKKGKKKGKKNRRK